MYIVVTMMNILNHLSMHPERILMLRSAEWQWCIYFFFDMNDRIGSSIFPVRQEISFSEQPKRAGHPLQKQLSIKDTVQQHFSQILKNDSINVTDNTTITETLMMSSNSSVMIDTSRKCSDKHLRWYMRD